MNNTKNLNELFEEDVKITFQIYKKYTRVYVRILCKANNRRRSGANRRIVGPAFLQRVQAGDGEHPDDVSQGYTDREVEGVYPQGLFGNSGGISVGVQRRQLLYTPF